MILTFGYKSHLEHRKETLIHLCPINLSRSPSIYRNPSRSPPTYLRLAAVQDHLELGGVVREVRVVLYIILEK
jgi:hypothetical protein